MSTDEILPDVLCQMLSRCFSGSKLHGDFLTSFIEKTCRCLIDHCGAENIEADEKNVELHNVILSIFIECAKLDLGKEKISHQLRSVPNISEEFVASFCDVYLQNADTLRNCLKTVGTSYPRIIDSNWKLDYQLQTDSATAINRPNFTVLLKTIENVKIDESPADVVDFMFQCNVEELQDMVWRLKEATKMAEKYSTAK